MIRLRPGKEKGFPWAALGHMGVTTSPFQEDRKGTGKREPHLSPCAPGRALGRAFSGLCVSPKPKAAQPQQEPPGGKVTLQGGQAHVAVGLRVMLTERAP